MSQWINIGNNNRQDMISIKLPQVRHSIQNPTRDDDHDVAIHDQFQQFVKDHRILDVVQVFEGSHVVVHANG